MQFKLIKAIKNTQLSKTPRRHTFMGKVKVKVMKTYLGSMEEERKKVGQRSKRTETKRLYEVKK